MKHRLRKQEPEYVFNTVWETIGKYLPEKEQPKFKEWFMYRLNKLGYCFDAMLILRAYHIYKELKNGLDHFVVFTGREGTGKSTLCIQFIAWIVPDNFTNKDICTTFEGFLARLSARYKQVRENINVLENHKGLTLDEGNELLAREAMSKHNVFFQKVFNIQRALGFAIGICIPNFFMLDTTVRDHRVKTLIHVIERGKYRCIFSQGIKWVSKEGKFTKNVIVPSLSRKFYFNGYFNQYFPNTIDKDNYIESKLDGIGELLEGANQHYITKSMYSTREAANVLGVTTETIANQIKAGKLEGKKVGGQYYITESAFNSLGNPKN